MHWILLICRAAIGDCRPDADAAQELTWAA
jgi:hypothetical protein